MNNEIEAIIEERNNLDRKFYKSFKKCSKKEKKYLFGWLYKNFLHIEGLDYVKLHED